MKVVAIIQARMGSSRLPGKVLMDLHGRPVLDHVLTRLRRARGVNMIGLATSNLPADDAIETWAAGQGVPIHRGSEEDVLDRFHAAALAWQADVVVRITADCPILDPDVVSAAVAAYLEAPCDYLSNAVERTYPDGLDVEVFSQAALQRAWEQATSPRHREHVTSYLYDHPDQFQLKALRQSVDRSRLRWTLDTPDDLRFLRAVFAAMEHPHFGQQEVLDLLEREPSIQEINMAGAKP